MDYPLIAPSYSAKRAAKANEIGLRRRGDTEPSHREPSGPRLGVTVAGRLLTPVLGALL